MSRMQAEQIEKDQRIETLKIDSRLSQLGLVAETTRALLSTVLNEQQTSEIQLSVIEGVTNVIEHAYGYEEGHQILVDFRLETDRIAVQIIDWGSAMDTSLLEKDSEVFNFDPDDIDSLPEGGMGLEIMKSYMDSIQYESESGKNVLSLVKNIVPDRVPDS